MKAVRAAAAGGPEVLRVEDLPDPVVADDDVLIDVVGAGINRADVVQRQGRYLLPPDASDVLGLEVAGTVAARGRRVTGFSVGDRVMALLTSGGYATRVAAPEGQVTAAPAGMDLIAAAGIPEVSATVVANLCMAANLQQGDTVLIHGATGGIGTFAIQFVKALGGRVAVTAGTEEKLVRASQLGADLLINYTDDDFAARMTADGGADIILDTVGAPYLSANIDALKPFGRLVTIGLQGGREASLSFPQLMRKRAVLTGTLLRDRSTAEKSAIMAKVRQQVVPLVESGAIKVLVDSVFPLSDVIEAHRRLDSREHVGKVVLDCR